VVYPCSSPQITMQIAKYLAFHNHRSQASQADKETLRTY